MSVSAIADITTAAIESDIAAILILESSASIATAARAIATPIQLCLTLFVT
ncbi:hypothetical protein KBT16_17635 [Nostoc sp. CCCryo 231-06]|nr:hypothetical protein [Nostoc sp. CCCryo 231-06]